MDNEPKISTVEIIFLTPFFVLADLIGAILVFFALDDFGIIDIALAPSLLYLWMKRVSLTSDITGKILEAIPYVGSLPFYTISWGVTLALDRGLFGKKIGDITKTAGNPKEAVKTL